MDVREKLVELICKMISPTITVGEQADYLIANGVTVQDGKDTGVPAKWIPVTERLPEDVYGKDREKIVVLVRTKSGNVSQCTRTADYDLVTGSTLANFKFVKNRKVLLEQRQGSHPLDAPAGTAEGGRNERK